MILFAVVLIVGALSLGVGLSTLLEGMRILRAARAARSPTAATPIASSVVGARVHVCGEVTSKPAQRVPSTGEAAVYVVAVLYRAIDNLGAMRRLIRHERHGDRIEMVDESGRAVIDGTHATLLGRARSASGIPSQLPAAARAMLTALGLPLGDDANRRDNGYVFEEHYVLTGDRLHARGRVVSRETIASDGGSGYREPATSVLITMAGVQGQPVSLMSRDLDAMRRAGHRYLITSAVFFAVVPAVFLGALALGIVRVH